MKKIFSFINFFKKLNIVVYNKNLQNILNINILDYRRLSKKLIIDERNGIGREYDNKDNQLLYEGEMLNGKRNGKGNEYGELIFEGEYLNGERNGKGKEYNGDGKLEFDRQYLNGERNGKGKEYNYDGKLEFE